MNQLSKQGNTRRYKEKSSPLDVALERRNTSVREIVSDALAQDRIRLAFQPVVSTNDPSQPVFFEGLLRVFDRSGRILPAKDFFGEADGTELGRKLDTRAIVLGLRTLAAVPNLRLSVNLSARSIGYRPWARALMTAISQRPQIGKQLILELNEHSAVAMSDVVSPFIRDMRHHGITFALDDCGAGYSSFRHFAESGVDILKIDGSLVRGIRSHADNQVIVNALMLVASEFDMIVVAEQVETKEEASFLHDIGCTLMQGYLLGAPTMDPSWETQR